MSYIGRDIRTGAFRQLDDISSGFDGSDTTHTMQVNSTNVSVGDVNQILLSLGGVIQKPGTDFTVSGSTLTFTTAPAANTSFFAILLGSDNGGTVTPTDGSVTGDKLASTVTTSSNITTTGTTSLDGAVTINESSADVDFRVESNANANCLHVDGGNSSVGINTTGASDASLQINDTVSLIKMLDTDDNTFSRMYHSAGNFLIDVDKGNTGGDSYFQIGIDDTQMLKIDTIGAMTLPKQPAFQAQPSGVQSNIGDSDTIEFATEIFDQNADYNNSTFTFTAPVTGKYLISGNVRIDNLDITGNPYHSLVIVTSNRAYYNLVSSNNWDADAQYFFFSITVLADMDANDTVYLRYQENSSAADQADVSTSSYFSAHLAC